MRKYTREGIIKAARDAAEASGGVLSRRDFARLTGISAGQIYCLFPKGGWTEVLELAGLSRHPMDNSPSSDDDILAEFHRVSCSLGRLPRSWNEYAATAQAHKDVIRKRFGGRHGLLVRYRTWLEEHGLDAIWLPELQQTPPQAEKEPSHAQAYSAASTGTKTQGPEYGAPLNFRGLQHAPINELGVVYLFGMVSGDLGYIVEAIQSDCPDCEAKRCVDKRRQRWQKVRIEFEFESSSFRRHGHDEAKCDVIVCWEHDWPDCPIEVVELRSELERLAAEPPV
jgi:hypothetical protein